MRYKKLLALIPAVLFGFSASAIEQVDGVYQIGTADDMTAFAELVNGGETAANAVLTADIDWSAKTTMLTEYAGTLDGQGHSLTINIESVENYVALVRDLKGTIENIVLHGTMVASGNFAASIAGQTHGNVLLRNCFCDMDFLFHKSGCSAFIGTTTSGKLVMENCAFAGTMKMDPDLGLGGFIGSTGGVYDVTLSNCLMLGEVECSSIAGDWGTYIFSRLAGSCTGCYYTQAFAENTNGATFVDKEIVESGELCCMLNKGLEEPAYFQTLGVDPCPVPVALGHKAVYVGGRLDCAGNPLGEVSYTNDENAVQQDEHQLESGVCKVCGYAVPGFASQDEEGFYQIRTADQLYWFAKRALTETDTKARLITDIDFTAYNTMLGDGVGFAGVLDGQNHTLTVKISGGEDGANYTGLVRELNGGTLENLILKGSIGCSTLFAGAIVGHSKSNAVIRNVVSEVSLSQIGSAGVAAFGGFVGHVEDTSIENSVFAGSIKTAGNSNGGICSWAAGLKVTSCACIGEIEAGDMTACMADCRGGNVTMVNYFYKPALNGCSFGGATQITDEQIKSGELAYLLNGAQTEAPVFYQTLGEDAYPVPFAEGHKSVFVTGEADCSGKLRGETTFNNEKDNIQKDEHEMVDGICANCGYVDSNIAEQDAEGFYLLGTAKELSMFMKKALVEPEIKARLMADIDFTEYNEMLGNGTGFAGIFDGQRHTVTINLTGGEDGNYIAFIRELDGGTVQDLVLKGKVLSSSLFAGGIVGHTMNNAVVRNVVSEVDLTQEGTGAIAGFGGFVGHIQDSSIENCIYWGTINTMGNSTSGVCGWAAGLVMRNCAVVGDITVSDLTACNADARGVNVVQENFYYKTALSGCCFGGATQVTDEQVKSGFLAYMLNSTQPDAPVFYQTLGEDLYPVPFAEGHKTVFIDGRLDCAGNIKNEETTFNNEKSTLQQDEHEMVDGVCIHCGYVDTSVAQPDAEGYYQIGTAEQLHWFVKKATSEPTAKARLTADIDFTSYNEMLGDGVGFAGIFDGQGYCVTVQITGCEDGANYAGFVRELNGGTLQDLILKGSVGCSTLFAGGVVGHTLNNAVIRNVVSEIAVSQIGNGATAGFGGFVGHIQDTTIENCIFAGSIYSPGNSTSGICGWADGLQITNSAVIADIEIGDMTECYADARGGRISQQNFYYKTQLKGCRCDGATQVSEEQIQNGALASLLNRSNSTPAWFQTLGEDSYPVPFASHALVLPVFTENGTSYIMAQTDNDAANCAYEFADAEKLYISNALCCVEVAEAFEGAIDEVLANVSTRNELWAAYLQLEGKKDAVERSVAAYNAYVEKVEYAKAYVEEHADELEGEYFEKLKSYLNDNDEPTEDFPNGTAQYVLEEKILSDEEIKDEAKFVDLLLKMAVENGYTAGADITNLLVNPDLSNGTNGWTVEGALSVNNGFGTSNGKFYMAQQVQGIQKEGIYAFMFDGYYKADADGVNPNYTSYIFANDVCNYVSMQQEALEEDVDNLFSNLIVANVTGNELTVGVETAGAGSYNETLVSDFQLYYLGTFDEASEALDDVIGSMVSHASVMLNLYECSLVDYYGAPNFSQALKNELQALTDEQPATGEEKYALILKYSDLFRRIYDCKIAYAQMMAFVDSQYDKVYSLAGSNILTPAQVEEYEKKIRGMEDAYVDGLYTAEEAIENSNWEIEVNIDLPCVDGIFQISTAEQLAYFCKMTNNGYSAMNAVLTSDIDFSQYNIMLGDGTGYAGTLDGQGYSVTINITGCEDGANYAGFVRELNGGTLQNLILKGTLASNTLFAGGIVGHTLNNAVIRNVASEVAMTQIGDGATAAFGGFVGHIQDTFIENCIFAGSIYSPGNSTSGTTGWASGLTMRNCAVIADIEYGDLTQCYADCRGNGIVQENFYYKTPLSGPFAAATQVSEIQIMNGELCQMLNQGQETTVWYQELGVDRYPLPMKRGGSAVEGIAAEIRTTGVFDLSGRKINGTEKLQRGIYIIDGKKTFVK